MDSTKLHNAPSEPQIPKLKSQKQKSFFSKLAAIFMPSTSNKPMANAAIFVGLFAVVGAVSLLASFAATPPNVALNKTVTVSSSESTTLKPANMVDANLTTRWASKSGIDPQWVVVDLGASHNVNRVVLNWEAAAGKNYDIQVGTAVAGPWTTIKSVTGNGSSGVKDYSSLIGSGRYVRIFMTSRVTQWGYSLYEVEVYGVTASTPPPVALTRYEAEKATYGGCSEIKTVSSAAASGGTAVGWFGQAGCQVTFTVNASAAGSYAAKIRYAMQPRTNGSAAAIARTQTVNGAVTTIQPLPSTTDSNNWWNVYTTKDLGMLTLKAGANTISFAVDPANIGLYWDFDYLEIGTPVTTPPPTTCPTGQTGTPPNCVTPPPPVNPPVTITPKRYEAEAATIGGCAEIKLVTNTNASGGALVGWNGQAGCQITYTVNAPSAGTYDVQIRYAMQPRSAGSSATIPRIETVNGVASTIQIAPTTTDINNWWNVFTTKDLGQTTLKAGTNTIAFSIDPTATGFYWDSDYLDLGGSAGTVTPVPTTCPSGTTGTPPNCAVIIRPPATNSPSGEAMPVGDITGWKQVFTEEFTTDAPLGSWAIPDYHKSVNASAYASKWTGYPNTWHDTSGNGIYDQGKTISVSGGVLNMNIHTENGVHEVAAPVPFIPGADANNAMTSGRYVVRFRSDAIPGYKTAWLLWPSSDTWPRDGEIDFPEGNLDSTISGFMHRMNGTSGGDQDFVSSNGVSYTGWHTAVTEWRGGQSLSFILDGKNLGTLTSRVPSTPMQWILQTETNLDGYAPNNSAAGNLQIDWVTVYAAN
jgi:hypothetical protein